MLPLLAGFLRGQRQIPASKIHAILAEFDKDATIPRATPMRHAWAYSERFFPLPRSAGLLCAEQRDADAHRLQTLTGWKNSEVM